MVTSAFSLVQMQPMMHNRFIFFLRDYMSIADNEHYWTH